MVVFYSFFLMTFYTFNTSNNPSNFSDNSLMACIGNDCFNVQIADTDKERLEGLMNITYLDKDEGMLFVFDEEGYYGFWMKDTIISLDMIWINKNLEIVNIVENAEPCLQYTELEECPIYYPNQESLYVLEVKGGGVDRLGIKEGDEVDIEI